MCLCASLFLVAFKYATSPVKRDRNVPEEAPRQVRTLDAWPTLFFPILRRKPHYSWLPAKSAASALCHIGGGACTDVQNSQKFLLMFSEIPTWFYIAIVSQWVSRVLIKVFYSVFVNSACLWRKEGLELPSLPYCLCHYMRLCFVNWVTTPNSFVL